MMKTCYQTMQIQVISFQAEDVIATSGVETPTDSFDDPFGVGV
ncbi:MAG: hypothetical protein ACI4NG_02750 [Candidatus Gallimonas sp.]